MQNAPWTKNRCVKGWKSWWQFDQEKELIEETNSPCKDCELKEVKDD